MVLSSTLEARIRADQDSGTGSLRRDAEGVRVPRQAGGGDGGSRPPGDRRTGFGVAARPGATAGAGGGGAGARSGGTGLSVRQAILQARLAEGTGGLLESQALAHAAGDARPPGPGQYHKPIDYRKPTHWRKAAHQRALEPRPASSISARASGPVPAFVAESPSPPKTRRESAPPDGQRVRAFVPLGPRRRPARPLPIDASD